MTHRLLLLLIAASHLLSSASAECDSCTLTVMCWIGGGQRQEGCSGPSWLMTCCGAPTRSDDDDDDDKAIDGARAVSSAMTLQPVALPLLQPPPPRSSSSGGLAAGPLFSQQLAPLANSLVEEIANFGRNELFGGSQASLLYPAINQGLALRWRHDQQQLQQQQFQQQLKQQQQLRSLHNQDMTGLASLPSQHRLYQKPKPPPVPSPFAAGKHPTIMTQQQLYQHKQRDHTPAHPPLLHSQQPFLGLNSIHYHHQVNHPNLGAKPGLMCGVQPLRAKSLQKRIIGGNQATFGEFPWQAHIRIAGFQCGGVLLNNQYIATAAHCVHRAKLSQIIIYLGEYDTKDLDKTEILPKETLGVIERKIHPQFKYMLTQPDRFDIALLKLSRSVHFRDNILPICLPPHGKDYEGALGVVAGWGKTDTSFGKTGTNMLQKVYVPIIHNRMCFNWHELKDIILELHDEMFCAGHEQGKMDACLGDSGGPLVVNDGGRWTLVGITSAGFGCAVDHQPGIYHKVSKTVPWLLANIND